MQVIGRVGTDPKKVDKKSGDGSYYQFSVAENSGKGEQQSTVWYDVNAFVSDAVMARVTKGARVEVKGILKASAYIDREGKPKPSLRILAGFVRAQEPRQEAENADAEGAVA